MPKPKTEGFEQKLQQIRELTSQLQSGTLSLEESLKSYQKARSLIEECTRYLDEAELSIQQLNEDGGLDSFNPAEA